MDDDLGELSRATGTDLPPDALEEVDDTGPNGKTPGEVAKADFWVVEGEGLSEPWLCGTTNEAPSSVCVEADHEEERQVMSIPECLKTLPTDFHMRGGIHEDHNEQHYMASDTSRLAIVHIDRIFRTYFYKQK